MNDSPTCENQRNDCCYKSGQVVLWKELNFTRLLHWFGERREILHSRTSLGFFALLGFDFLEQLVVTLCESLEGN